MKVHGVFKKILIGFIILLGLIILTAGIFLIVLTRSHTPGIKGNNSIASLEEINLGGLKQTILIRGNDKSNPVLLYLHGGPGSPLMPSSHITDRKLEEKFIVVHWDQRGAGKSFNSNIRPEDLQIEKYLSDTYDLIRYLCARFDKKKIYLLGHSWGTYLGIMTAYRHPEVLYAYIGMGQVINMPAGESISYSFVMEKAREENNRKVINDLTRIGPPPYDNFDELGTQRSLVVKYGGMYYHVNYPKMILNMLSSPEYSIWDSLNDIKGMKYSLTVVWNEFQKISVEDSIKSLAVPVYFFEGKHDYCVPSEILVRYFGKLKAPHKEIIWFENSAHMMNIEETGRFQDILINKVVDGN